MDKFPLLIRWLNVLVVISSVYEDSFCCKQYKAYEPSYENLHCFYDIFFHRDLLSPNLILSELYPGDHGSTSPNLSNQYELNKFG